MEPPRVGRIRSIGRSSLRRPSFRDDASIVSVRYEKTKQGAAPTPVTTLNLSRGRSRPCSSSAASATSHRRGPIIIIPPRQLVEPPAEQHPALRESSSKTARTLACNEWKRDSGHAQALSSISSTPTINEEDCEDGQVFQFSRLSQCQDYQSQSDTAASKIAVQRFYDADVADDEQNGKELSQSELEKEATNHISAVSGGAAEAVAPYLPYSTSTSSSSCHDSPPPPRPSKTLDSPSKPLHLATRSPPKPSSRPASANKPFSLRTMMRGESLNDVHRTRDPRASAPTPASLAAVLPLRAPAPAPATAPPLPAQVPAASAPPPATGAPALTPPPPPPPLERGSSRPLLSPDNHATTSRKEQLWQNPKSPSVVATLWAKVPFTSRTHPHPPSSSSTAGDAAFAPLSVSIPTSDLLDDDFIGALSFSRRGSVMFGRQRAPSLDETRTMDISQSSHQHNGPMPAATDAAKVEAKSLSTLAPPSKIPTPTTDSVAPSDVEGHDTRPPADTEEAIAEEAVVPAQEPPQTEALEPQAQSQPDQTAPERTPSQRQVIDASSFLAPPPNIHVMGADVDRDSQKVRSLYAVGDAIKWEDGAGELFDARQNTPRRAATERNEQSLSRVRAGPAAIRSVSGGPSSRRDHVRKEVRIAGGLEDHDDLEGAVVDRYGFITIPRPVSSRLGAPTELKSAQFSPRRRILLQKRDPSGLSSPSAGGPLTPSRKTSARSLHTTHSARSGTSLRSSRSVIRQAGNLLPHNRERKWMDEAGEMLTVAPNLQDIAEEAQVERISEALKRKEWERSEKWRKMARNIRKENQGEGMEFEFDTKNTKLIERTWKGIPDRWRAAAWWAFMASAAKARPGSATEEEIIADFHRLQTTSSPDDVQIDLDVPRTISRHIMFRKRYSGGQRLLFRVLHALSIYYPVTGYVQGMASLGATLLCYFDEEKCFVMLVRMWRFRGLDRLYRPGFEGLMTALNEFETLYLNKDVAKNLTEQCIDATAYGTRWYLTLFNLSLPFPAQLRVWDVFLLLGGDGEKPEPKASAKKPSTPNPGDQVDEKPPPTGLDVLHATSAAIVQALKEVLLDSDFENAMKALTSAIPIKDEDILMKVTKAEWKAHAGKRKA